MRAGWITAYWNQYQEITKTLLQHGSLQECRSLPLFLYIRFIFDVVI
jgi:hypothetical protein